MNYIVKVNGYKLELDQNKSFERVVQRNTVGNFTNRQSSFTSTIKVYKTGRNYEFFEFLDVSGVNSEFPYIVLKVELLSESGNIVTRKARAFIEMTDKDFFYLNVYDGYIDFLKLIKNKTLNDLNLGSLNHNKNIQEVINSWQNDKKYIYLVSDFNGNNLQSNKLNIDFQLPAASIAYIWKKIFDFTSYTFDLNGLLENSDFKDLYISYPKPIDNEIDVLPVLEQKNDFQYIVPYNALQFSQWQDDLKHPWLLPIEVDNEYFKNESKTSPTLQGNDPGQPNVSERLYPPTGFFKKAGIYRLSFSGYFYTADDIGTVKITSEIYYKVTDQDFNAITSGQLGTVGNDVENSVDFEVQQGFYLFLYVKNDYFDNDSSIHDQISTGLIDFLHDRGGKSVFLTDYNNQSNLGITTKLEYFDSESVDFANVFGNIKIRDFIKEIMIRFGLTPYPSFKNKHIDFLLQETIFQNKSVDFSDNFVKELNTKYAYDNYYQKNYLRYKYNDKEADHNDGSIDVDNDNLKFENDFYNSLFYSPVVGKSSILNFDLIKTKAWNRNIDEDSNVEYEKLKGRFYLLKKKYVDQSLGLSSSKLGNTGTAQSFYKASFDNLDFNSVLKGPYYSYTDSIIKKSKVRKVVLYLTEIEYMNVDLKRTMYLKQYSRDFLIDKIKERSDSNEYIFDLIEIAENKRFQPQVPPDNNQPADPIETNDPPTIQLIGGEVTLKFNEYYNEPGFSASDAEDGDLTNNVNIDNTIDSQTPGNYTLTYSVKDSNGLEATATRNVLVEQNQPPQIVITAGSVSLEMGQNYVEPGFTAYDNEDGDLTNQVQVTNNIDYQTPGEYQITYFVIDSGGLSDTMTRTIIIEGNCETFIVKNTSNSPNNWVQIKFRDCDGNISSPRRINKGQTTSIDTKKKSSIFIDGTDPYVQKYNFSNEGISIEINKQ